MARGGLVMAHRWLGLVAILPLAVLLLSGAGLSFVHEFDRAMHPQLLSVAATQALDIDGQETIVKDELSRTDADLLEIRYPNTPYDPLRLLLQQNSEQSHRYINPHTGQLLGDRSIESEWGAQLLKLHTGLINLEFGSLLTLIGSVALVLMLLLGISLLRQASRWRVRGWHAWLGLCCFPVLMLITISGLLSITGIAAMNHVHQAGLNNSGSLATVLTSKQAAIGQLCQVAPLTLKSRSDGKAELHCQNDTQWLLQLDRAAIQLQTSDSNDRLLWNLHSGEWAGLPGRAFWMWAVLAVLYLFYSGLRDWLIKIRQRNR